MKYVLLLLSSIALISCASKNRTVSGVANEDKSKLVKPHKEIPLFQSDDVLPLIIKSNFPYVNKASANQDKKHSGTLTYTKKSGKEKTIDIQLSARGGGRSWWCDFAPMKLMLPAKSVDEAGAKKDPLKKTIFKNSKRSIKLVTHCKPNDHGNPDLNLNDGVVAEHLLYQLVKAAGFPYFNTRLAKAKYLDDSGNDFSEAYLIFLENFKDLAQRYGGVELDSFEGILPKARVSYDFSLRLTMNEVDHWFERRKNSTTFGVPDGKGGFTSMTQVPYDYVYGYLYFPYGLRMENLKTGEDNDGWFRKYEEKHPELKAEIQKQARLLMKSHNNMLVVINKAPFTKKGEVVRDRIRSWVNTLVLDAKRYLQVQF